MSAALATLLPILMLIALGALIGRVGLIDASGWRAVDKLLFSVLFPALVVEAVARAGGSGSEPFRMAAVLGLGQITILALALVLRSAILRLPGGSRPAFGSFIQGVVRWNTAVAVAVVAAVHGQEGVTLIAFGVAVMIPVANLVSVTALTIEGDNNHSVSIPSILAQLARNPFLQAVGLGILLALSPVAPPRVLFDTLHQLAQAATGVALLSVGAGLDLKRVAGSDPLVLMSTVLKLIAMPIVVFGLATVFGLGEKARAVALIAAAVPTASAGYVLARQMGGDADLMARIIALHTAVAVVTVPMIIALSG